MAVEIIVNKKLYPISVIGLLVFIVGVVSLLNYNFTNQNIVRVPVRIDYSMAVSSALNLKLKSNGLVSLNNNQQPLTNSVINVADSSKLSAIVLQVEQAASQ